MARKGTHKPPKVWSEAYRSFVAGDGTLREIAERCGLTASAVYKRARRDGWAEARHAVAAEAERRAAEQDVESVARRLARHRYGFRRAFDLALRELEKAADLEVVSPLMLDRLTTVLARVVPLERLAAGIEPAKPVKVLDATDEAEVVIEVDPPKGSDEEPPAIEAVT